MPFNDAAALERVLARGGVAAVITEPALTNVGVVPPDPGFHARVRELTREHGALLILDETHTQTAAHGGCTAPGASSPTSSPWARASAAASRRRVRHDGRPARRLERHRDAHGRVAGIATGGTTYAKPLSLAAVVATLHNPDARGFERTAALGARLADGIEAAAARHGLPWRAHRLGGRSGYCLEPELPRTARTPRSLDDRLVDARRLYMANRGIWEAIASAGPGRRSTTTEADVDEDLTCSRASSSVSGRSTPPAARARAWLAAGESELSAIIEENVDLDAARVVTRRAARGVEVYGTTYSPHDHAPRHSAAEGPEARTSGSSNASLDCSSPVFASG